jgi:SAM-dependent methyltransferase
MSVVEHGVDIRRFFAEVARLLRPGGLSIVSTDYWPFGLETEGLRRFGYIDRDDRIFSTEDVRALVGEAGAHGLRLIDELDLDVDVAPIEAHGLNYTFLTIRFKLDGAEDSEGPPAADERR